MIDFETFHLVDYTSTMERTEYNLTVEKDRNNAAEKAHKESELECLRRQMNFRQATEKGL